MYTCERCGEVIEQYLCTADWLPFVLEEFDHGDSIDLCVDCYNEMILILYRSGGKR